MMVFALHFEQSDPLEASQEPKTRQEDKHWTDTLIELSDRWPLMVATDSKKVAKTLSTMKIEYIILAPPISGPTHLPNGTLQVLEDMKSINGFIKNEDLMAFVNLRDPLLDVDTLEKARRIIINGDNDILLSVVPFRDNPVQLRWQYDVQDIGMIGEKTCPIKLKSSNNRISIHVDAQYSMLYNDCLLRIYSISKQGTDVIIDFPLAYSNVIPIKETNSQQLAYMILKTITHGPFSMIEGYKPQFDIWDYDMSIPTNPSAVDSSTKQKIAGRQMFPNTYQASRTFCLLRGGRVDIQSLDSDELNVELFKLDPSLTMTNRGTKRVETT